MKLRAWTNLWFMNKNSDMIVMNLCIWRILSNHGSLVQVGNGIELEAVASGLQFELYRWCPCGVTWDSSRTVVVIKLRRTSALSCMSTRVPRFQIRWPGWTKKTPFTKFCKRRIRTFYRYTRQSRSRWFPKNSSSRFCFCKFRRSFRDCGGPGHLDQVTFV